MTTNPRKTPAQWAEFVSSFHASGLIQREFCTQHGIGSSTLDKRKRRVAESVPGYVTRAPFIRVHPINDSENTTVTLQDIADRQRRTRAVSTVDRYRTHRSTDAGD